MKHVAKCSAVFVTLLLLLLLASCGTLKAYPGEELPNSQTALIQGNSRFPLHLVQIRSINNITITSGKDKVRVLPGHHFLTVELYQSYVITHISVQGNIAFDAQPGMIYTIEGRFEAGDAKFDITGVPAEVSATSKTK